MKNISPGFLGAFFIVLLGNANAQTEPPPPEHNLLRNTRLVAGLPSGWTLTNHNNAVFSEGDDLNYQTDESVKGPSGHSAFLVDVLNKKGVPSPYGWQKDVEFYTEPFRVSRNGPFTASVQIMGSGAGHMEVVSDDLVTVVTVPFSSKEAGGWTRVNCTFDGSVNAKLYGIRFRMQGKLWFDSFQVNAGPQPQAYRSEYPGEIALAPAPGELASIRTQFAGEPATMRWVVTDAPAGTVLKGRVTDLNGTAADLPPVKLTTDRQQGGNWNYALAGLAPLGQFRVEAWLEDAAGKTCSAFDELVMTRIRPPRFWKQDAPDSPFGIHVMPTTQGLLLAKAFGMNWARLHDAGLQLVGWFYVEQEPGKWQFFDREIQRYRDHNLTLMGQLGTAPLFRSLGSKSTALPPSAVQTKTATYFQPNDPKEYADYVRRAVTHYAGQIHTYDIWNEPWNPLFFSIDYMGDKEPASKHRAARMGANGGWYLNSPEAPAEYVKLEKAAFETIKSIDPKIAVVGMNTHGSKVTDGRFTGTEWSEKVAAAGGMKYLDTVGFHLYLSTPLGFKGDAIDDGMRIALGPLGGAAGLNKGGHHVWMTEGSPANRQTRSGFYHRTLPFQEVEDYWAEADRVARFEARLLAEGVEKVFLYSTDAATYFGQKPRARIFVTEDGFPHPTAAAASTVAWHLEGTKYRTSALTSDGTSVYVFDGAGGSVAVLFPKLGSPTVVPHPAGLTVEDVFGNPPKNERSAFTIFLQGPREHLDAWLQTLK